MRATPSLLVAAGLAVLSAGCVHAPRDAFLPLPAAQASAVLNTRRYVNLSDRVMLSACAAALQDLGFTLDESEGKVGLIVATKDRSAKKKQTTTEAIVQTTAEIVASVALTLLVAQPVIAHDDDPPERQVIRASLTAQREPGALVKEHVVRITFQRVVYSKKNRVLSAALLSDPGLSQGFFDALAKSIFLEVQAP